MGYLGCFSTNFRFDSNSKTPNNLLKINYLRSKSPT